jgi:hypothetical protein
MDMISLIVLLGAFGANAALATHFGADSRQHDDRRDW